VEVLASVRSTLARAGVRNEADFDLWTAVVVGLAGQHLANDPGGDRYIRLIDDAVTMFADTHPRPELTPKTIAGVRLYLYRYG